MNNKLSQLSRTAERNSINYNESEEASGLVPPSEGMPGARRQPKKARPMADISGEVAVTSISGAKVGASLIETANIRGRIDPVVQFSIDNSGVGATNQKVRIGSVAAQPDAFSRFGLTPGSADDAVITDQLGAGCLKVQGYSLLTSHKAMVVNEIHIISDNLTQLNAEFFHKLIHPNNIIDDRSNNIAFTQQKTDQKETLNVAKGKWMIDSNQFLEFTAFAGQSITVLLHHIAIANVSTFTEVQ